MTSRSPTDWNIPHDHPYYPHLPARYEHLKMQMVFFQAEPEAVAAFLPEPLLPVSDGSCVAGGLSVSKCKNYGPFDETWVQIKCFFEQQEGWFCSHVPHNQPNAIAAGREIYGTPKVFAEITVNHDQDTMHTTCKLEGEMMMTITSTMNESCDADKLPSVSPSWRLKIIPKADGPGAALKQLINCSSAVSDVVVHDCRRGNGSVQFMPNQVCDLSSLSPRKIGDVYYLDTSFTEGYASIVHDYLL